MTCKKSSKDKISKVVMVTDSYHEVLFSKFSLKVGITMIDDLINQIFSTDDQISIFNAFPDLLHFFIAANIEAKPSAAPEMLQHIEKYQLPEMLQ